MNRNTGLPQNAPWASSLVQPWQVMQNPRAVPRATLMMPHFNPDRAPNMGMLGWIGAGAGLLALGGGAFWLYRRHLAASSLAETGVVVTKDCTKLSVAHPETAQAFLGALIDEHAQALAQGSGGRAVPLDTLTIGAAYIADVAPQCGVSVTEQGIAGVDTWQKAAMVGGVALLAAARLKDQQRLTDAAFTGQAQAIQDFLLAHGVDDPAMLEDVFEMPEGSVPQDGVVSSGLTGAGAIGTRQPNMGIIGGTLLALGTATAGAGGYFWWRNEELRKTCLADKTWFGPDGTTLDPAVQDQLDAAIDRIVASGVKDPVAVADTAIVELSGNPACHLPRVIWGDLLRLRLHAALRASAALGLTQLPTPKAPTPEETGVEFKPDCSVPITLHDDTLFRNYIFSFIDAHEGIEPGMSWQPNAMMLSAEFLELVAPQCGIYVQKVGAPTIMGVTDDLKGIIFYVFTVGMLAALEERGILTEAQTLEQLEKTGTWITEEGPGQLNLNDLGEKYGPIFEDKTGDDTPPFGDGREANMGAAGWSLFGLGVAAAIGGAYWLVKKYRKTPEYQDLPPPPTGAGPGPTEGPGWGTGEGAPPTEERDDWGESLENEMIESGSVSGPKAALWRVYRDNLDEWDRPYYFVTWRKGQYTKLGSYDDAVAAKTAAIDWIMKQPLQAGVARHNNPECAGGKKWCPGLVTGTGSCCFNCDDPLCGAGSITARSPSHRGKMATRMQARTAGRRPRGWCGPGEHLCPKKTPGGSSGYCCCDSTGECVGGKIVLANPGRGSRPLR